MLLNSEELLALVHGDVEPDRLADLLDRLEHCSESAAALQVLVTLRANREQALGALFEASEADPTPFGAIPHTAARNAAMAGWAVHGLRLAATIALVAIIGAWAVSAPVAPADVQQSVGIGDLATTDYQEVIMLSPIGVRLTASSDVVEANALLRAEKYAEVLETLRGMPDDQQYVALFRGIAQYHLGNYDQALAELRAAQLVESGDAGPRRQATWYEANTLIAMERPLQALLLLEELKSLSSLYPLQEQAARAYEEIWHRLGLADVDGELLQR